MSQTSNSLVSIVIPFFNKTDTIDRSIQSVINQTYINWELLVIDDKSINPLYIKKEWNTLKLNVIRNEINLGAGKSREKGQKLAKGKYIAFLDADDWWDEGFLENCVKQLESSSKYIGCYGNVLEYKDGIIKKRNSYSGLEKIRETVIGYYRPWQTSSVVWRRELIGEWGKLKTREDAWFEITSSIKNNHLCYLNNINCYVDKTGENHLSISNGKLQSALDQLELFLMVYDTCWTKINLRSKIILINRLLVCCNNIYKHKALKENPINSILFNRNKFVYWFTRNAFVLKLVIKFLEKTPFKIHV
jgi:glycosyltransferase involved in cell wall biosynthesis